MKIYIDADACPKAIKEILYKAAKRKNIELILVANQALQVPKHSLIKTVQVGQGFDVADNYIANAVQANDLVITADIPLANDVVQNKGFALNPRGELYTEQTIKNRLATRNLMEELRSNGVVSGGPKAIDKKDIQKFANALDRYLSKFKAK